MGISEDFAAYLFKQFMHVLEYCMENRVSHMHGSHCTSMIMAW